MDKTSTTETALTTASIRALRREAAAASDLITFHACDLLTGDEPEITDVGEWEERYGGGGWDADDYRAVIGMDVAAAKAIVTRVIEDARAMLD